MLLQVDFRTGFWTGSAPRLAATAPRGSSLRDIQRAMQRIEEIGFTRTFHQQGQRGNYRVLIHKYEPQSGALRGMRLNAVASKHWKQPVYDTCAEPDTENVAVTCAEPVAEAAPYLEVEVKREEEQKEKAAPVRPSQDAVSELSISVENMERQFNGVLRGTAKAKSLTGNGRPADRLRAEIFDGIYRKKIADCFFDLEGQPFREQIEACVQEAVGHVMSNRVRKMKHLHDQDIARLAIQKLGVGVETLSYLKDFSDRRDQVTAAVVKAVVNSAAELYEASAVSAEPEKISA